jgi:hypothetical protein
MVIMLQVAFSGQDNIKVDTAIKLSVGRLLIATTDFPLDCNPVV